MSDIANLLREAATYVGPCGDTELVEKLLAAAESLGEPVAWLVTKGRTYVDRAYINRRHAQNAAEDREDGSVVEPLYLAPQPAVPEWQPIETAPHNKPVLIHYKNGCGKGRTIKAEFIPANTIEASGEYDDHCEYNEALDTYFWPEGWHEMIDNWGEYSHVVVNETPTHWMPLPEPPAGDSHHE